MESTNRQNLAAAFKIAEEVFGVPQILDQGSKFRIFRRVFENGQTYHGKVSYASMAKSPAKLVKIRNIYKISINFENPGTLG